MRPHRLLLTALLVLPLAGCHRALNAMTDTPEFRKGVVEKGRSSCMTSANNAVKTEKTPQVEGMITNYCDCIADKGLAMFSNADLVEIGVKGIDRMTPEQKKTFDGAVTMCQTQAFHK